MKLRIDRAIDAAAIAEALTMVYPTYRMEAYKPKGARLYRIRAFCKVTGALLLTDAEI